MSSLKTQNPFTGEVIKEFSNWSEEDISKAMDNSWQAFQKYKQTDVETRAQRLLKVAEVIKDNKQEYAKLITLEMGKPIKEAEGELDRCIQYCEFYSENAQEFMKNKTVESKADENYVVYQPLGPLVLVQPWNFPFWLPFKTVIPQLVVGNTVLVKNASNTPQCGQKLQEVFEKAGFEEGVYQYAPISSSDLEVAISHHYCRGASLTGSTGVGKKFAGMCAKNIKK
jgi:succinate-semialdehyde dehydrogenase/glutarate-semialdehyde dehydrogenase